jgi:hypothetical protein
MQPCGRMGVPWLTNQWVGAQSEPPLYCKVQIHRRQYLYSKAHSKQLAAAIVISWQL